jgi:large subunit ribosomal protein L6
MSRLANMPIMIPSSVNVTCEKNTESFCLTLSNGKINESWTVHPKVQVAIDGDKITISMKEDDRSDKFFKSMLGTDYRHIENLVKGLDKPFETVLEIHGLGYRVKLMDTKVTLSLGKSHDDVVTIPEHVSVDVPNEREIICKSHSKKLLGDFVALLCSKRKPDAYKAKGVRIRGVHYRTKSDK